MIVFGKAELALFVARALTKRQLEVFCLISSLNGLSYSGIVRQLEGKYPQSTVKYILKRLRDLGLVNFDVGRPLVLTRLGNIVRESCSVSETDILEEVRI